MTDHLTSTADTPDLTVRELFEHLTACAGLAATDDPPEQNLDTGFSELGYDSLALIETAARIKHATGRVVPDRIVGEVETPREMLAALNDPIATA